MGRRKKKVNEKVERMNAGLKKIGEEDRGRRISAGMKKRQKKVKLPAKDSGLSGKYWNDKVINMQVINTETFFKSLLKEVVCRACHGDLKFNGPTNQKGLHCNLNFECKSCKRKFKIESSDKVYVPVRFLVKRKYPRAAVNIQVIMGATASGIGHRQLNGLLASAGLNTFSENAFGSLRDILNGACEELIKESEHRHIKKEMELSCKLSFGKDGGITLVTDGSWASRGSGRSYSSNVGYVLGTGSHTKKIISHEIASKKCKKCEFWENLGKRRDEIPKHKCARNYNQKDSSKSMEGKLTVKMVQEVNKRVKVARIGGDNDSTVSANLRKAGLVIPKDSDLNHTCKNLQTWLESLKKRKYSGTKFKNILTNKQRQSIVNGYIRTILKKTRGKEKEMIECIRNLPSHLFGDHKKCNSEWCKDKGKTEEEIKKNKHFIRYRSNLTNLRKDLDQFAADVIGNIAKLVWFCDSNHCESGNNAVHAVMNKRTDNSKSNSHRSMIAFGSARFNDGSNANVNLLEKLNVPPNQMNQDYFRTIIRNEKKQSINKKRIETKKRRKELRKTKRSELERNNNEFDYKTGMGLRKMKSDNPYVTLREQCKVNIKSVNINHVNIDDVNTTVQNKHLAGKYAIKDIFKYNLREEKRLFKEFIKINRIKLEKDEMDKLFFTFISDTETTGLGDDDVVIQIGIKHYHSPIVYSTLLNPPKELYDFDKKSEEMYKAALDLSGIKVSDIKRAPGSVKVYNKLNEIVNAKNKGSILFWNVPFDKRMLIEHSILEKTNFKVFSNSFLEASMMCAVDVTLKTHDREKVGMHLLWKELNNVIVGMNPLPEHVGDYDVMYNDDIYKYVPFNSFWRTKTSLEMRITKFGKANTHCSCNCSKAGICECNPKRCKCKKAGIECFYKCHKLKKKKNNGRKKRKRSSKNKKKKKRKSNDEKVIKVDEEDASKENKNSDSNIISNTDLINPAVPKIIIRKKFVQLKKQEIIIEKNFSQKEPLFDEGTFMESDFLNLENSDDEYDDLIGGASIPAARLFNLEDSSDEDDQGSVSVDDLIDAMDDYYGR